MSKLFYSDNGSTAVEVALKMAHQYHQNKGETGKTKIIALEGAYHGDTVGAMSVSARSLFTEQFNGLLFDVSFIPFPEKKAIEAETLSALETLLQANDVSAFIVEPLVQGAAGMRMYSVEVLEKMFLLCQKYDCLIIADEVMTGFGRTGSLFACHKLQQTAPDIICLSKGLTGGTLPMGATACKQAIFDAFLSDDAHKTLYHGHSFTANPVGCAAGLASLDLLLSEEGQNNIDRVVQKHSTAKASLAKHPRVKEINQWGTVLSIEIITGIESTGINYLDKQRDTIYKFFIDRKILMRPLGNILYLLPPYCITDEQLDLIYATISELLDTL